MPTRLPIFLIDATSILSYVHKKPNATEIEKNASQQDVYNFCKVLIDIAKKFNVAHIAIVWDGRKGLKKFTGYEAEKKVIMDFINSMRMEQILQPEIATLDIIFSMIASFNHQHHNIVVVTADENLYSFASDAVTIYNPWEKYIKVVALSTTPHRHPNPTTTARTTFHEKNWQLALPFFEKLDYKKLALAIKIKPTEEPSLQALIEKNYNHTFSLMTISSQDQLIKLCDQIKKAKSCAMHLQGTNIDPMISKPLSLSIAIDEKTVHYISLQNKNLSTKDIVSCLKPLCADKSIEKIMHLATFHTIALEQLGMPVDGPIFDVLVAASLVMHSPSENSLDVLNAFYAKNALLAYQEKIVENKAPEKQNFIDEHAWNCAADAHQIVILKGILEAELAKEKMLKLFQTIEMPVNNVLKEMELAGIYCDAALLKKIDTLATKEIQIITKEVAQYSKVKVNLNSVPQVRKLLFETLNLPILKKTHTSTKLHKRRNDATDHEALVELSKIHPIAQLIIRYRELYKFKKAYLTSLPEYINAKTKKIHAIWNQDLGATDRISCTHPNLQNIPTGDYGFGMFIRSAFQAQDNNIFIGADYNEIELHIIAHLSQDKALKAALATKQDIHAVTAANLYATTKDKVTPEQRSIAKKINLSIAYGLTPYGLARDQDISIKEAAFAIKTFFAQYPGVQAWMKATIETAQKDLYVTTLHGKKRYIDKLHSVNRVALDLAFRLAINTIVQGSATEIMKIAMINIQEKIAINKLQAQILLNIHDQLVVSTPKVHSELIINIVQDAMIFAASKDFALTVSVMTGQTWHDVTKE